MPATATPHPTLAQFPSERLTLSAGIAIFHLATSRVVICYHTTKHFYFLPKGRKNANESLERAAEREGFEESGYRCRLLPLAMKHRATYSSDVAGEGEGGEGRFATEPCWMQLMPVGKSTQYTLFWFVGETVPSEVERGYAAAGEGQGKGVYRPPEPWPRGLTVRERIKLDVVGDGEGGTRVYEPVWHDGMAQDEDEMCFRSYFMPVDEACRVLRGSVMEDVVRRGWEGIQLRIRMEEDAAAAAAVAEEGGEIG